MAKRKRLPKVTARRGRPKKEEALGPTPELMAKKLALVGPGGDVTLASYPLGVYLSRRIVTQDEHDAGVYYAYLAGRVLGKIHPGPATEGAYNPHVDSAADEIIEDRWRKACEILQGVSRQTKDAVDNAAVHMRFPRDVWDDSRQPNPKLLNGLKALSKWWLQNGRRAA